MLQTGYHFRDILQLNSVFSSKDKTLTDAQLKAADINGNGEAVLTDLARMKQYISKVITSLR